MGDHSYLFLLMLLVRASERVHIDKDAVGANAEEQEHAEHALRRKAYVRKQEMAGKVTWMDAPEHNQDGDVGHSQWYVVHGNADLRQNRRDATHR